MAQLNANLTDYEAQEGFDCLPPGWYTATITDSEIKTGKTSGKQYIQWTFQIDGKPNRIWHTTSLGNDVSMRILKTMATCCGHRNPNYIADTEELHGKRCQVKLAIEKDDNGDYDPKNVIKAFKPSIQSQANQQAGIIPTAAVIEQQQQIEPAKTPKMPWEA